ncbi:protein phosphatase 2C domain-containing protein [Arthrobacter sp. B1805]|uniref:protein phosphatase 2C domain-containing protein n=1 Tax=Arthrobacter sp. B1805 TaxID=2058892 RepID=UPI000CE347A4|nr:protein phosphatase 2C domain-containing protein [Arthrobacter sp. B1805]
MTAPAYSWFQPQSLSVPGALVNEDAVAVSASSLIMIDGATGLAAGRRTGWPSDAQWLAHSLAPLLADRLDGDISIADALGQCLDELRIEYGDDDDGGLGPSASVLIARITGSELEVYSLGDCLALVGMADGSVASIRDGAVGELDAAVLSRLQELRRGTDLAIDQARALVQDLLVGNRKLRNRPEGYWIADLSAAGVGHALTRTLPAAQVRDVALMTDGYAAALDVARLVGTAGELLQELRRSGPVPLMGALVARLSDDPSCTAFPRLKPMDDSSVVIARLLGNTDALDEATRLP